MSEIDSTTKRLKDPVEASLYLMEALANEGHSGQIEAMEATGQRQLVNSDRLPTDRKGDFAALGFTFGEPDKDDPMFCPATLPPGWKREGSDHAMWSYITDEHGRQRVAIFYKAAFYDRSAFMRLESLEWYVTKHVEHGGPLVITADWATRETVLAAMGRCEAAAVAEAADFRRLAADGSRGADNQQGCAEIADRKDAEAAAYTTRIRELSSTV